MLILIANWWIYTMADNLIDFKSWFLIISQILLSNIIIRLSDHFLTILYLDHRYLIWCLLYNCFWRWRSFILANNSIFYCWFVDIFFNNVCILVENIMINKLFWFIVSKDLLFTRLLVIDICLWWHIGGLSPLFIWSFQYFNLMVIFSLQFIYLSIHVLINCFTVVRLSDRLSIYFILWFSGLITFSWSSYRTPFHFIRLMLFHFFLFHFWRFIHFLTLSFLDNLQLLCLLQLIFNLIWLDCIKLYWFVTFVWSFTLLSFTSILFKFVNYLNHFLVFFFNNFLVCFDNFRIYCCF